MPSSGRPVLIAGPGPTGLTMALSLAKYGVKIRIIEEATSPHAAIRGTGIMPRTLELLAILGVKDEVDAKALPPLQMAIYDSAGTKILKTFDWSTAAEDVPTINSATISQAVLEEILHRHLAASGFGVEMGKKLVGITQGLDQVTASVQLSDGTIETVHCDFLVSADGAKGHSRRLLSIPFIGETKEADRMFTANVKIAGFSREYWHRWGDFAKAAIGLKPVEPAPLFQLQALGPTMQKDLPGDVTSLQKFFNTIAIREDIVFDTAEWITEWKANIRMAEKFSSGRAFLAGDVAHCHSPAGGQGTSTAMQDAFNLAWKMALVQKNLADISLLETYDSERIPVVAEMLNLSNELHARAFAHIPDTAFESPVSSTADDPMQRSAKVLQLGINYRWSRIVLDARDTGEQSLEQNPYGILGTKVRAGDRAPFFGGVKTGDKVTDLFQLLRESAGAHLVLVFPAEEQHLADEVKAMDKYTQNGLAKVMVVVGSISQDIDAVVDVKHVAYSAYDINEQKTVWVAIRPDGIIGAYYVYGSNEIASYFARLERKV